MGSPTDAMMELAQKLITLEGADVASADAAIRVIEKLRLLVVRFSGSDGFTALMRRAVALSKLNESSRGGYKLKADGSIASLDGISGEAGLTLIAHLLALMTMFIGQALTLSLLNDVWPLGE